MTTFFRISLDDFYAREGGFKPTQVLLMAVVIALLANWLALPAVRYVLRRVRGLAMVQRCAVHFPHFNETLRL